jgi:GNAT superfamily N-acetyltransferase
MYTVRRAVETDLPGLVRLQNQHAGVTAVGPSEQERRTWERMLATPILAVYVALWDDEIVGNTCMTIVPNLINDCRPAAFVEPMLVAAGHRRRGVGRLMVERLLEDAETAGCFKGGVPVLRVMTPRG